ncbi:TonB-dependent receptor [Methylorubrum populi]|uniref:TonB-dependent receptor n=1 Tax=Methylorubrum populi TaxID=223967 RepID=UPI002F350857
MPGDPPRGGGGRAGRAGRPALRRQGNARPRQRGRPLGRDLGAAAARPRPRQRRPEGPASVDAGANGIAVHADGFATATDSYAIPGGIQRNSATETQGGSVGISAIGDRGFLGIAYSHFTALYQIPGGAAEEARTRLTPNQDRVLARGEYRPLDGPFEVLRFWAGGSVYRHEEIGIGEDGIEGVQAIFKNREVEARFEAQHVPVETRFGTLTGALGVQTSRRVLNTQLEAFLPPTESRVLAGYLFEELAVGGGLRFQAAGRIEGDRLNSIATQFPGDYLPDGTDPASYALTRRFAPKSASIGALQDLPYGFVASLNGSYVERAPTGYELFSQGPHDATATFEIGDPTLRLERARTMELSLRRGVGPLRIDATGYLTRYTGFIYKRDTGNRCDDDFASCGSGDELRQVVYSQANTTFYGAEIAAQLDLLPVGDGWAGLEAQYDFVRAQFDDGRYVPRIPPHRLGGGAFVRANGWFARINLLHAFDHTEIATFETPTKGWNDLRAELAYTQALDPALYGAAEVTRSSTSCPWATAGRAWRRSTISCAPSSTTAATCRASRPTGSAAGPSCGPMAGSRGSTCSMPSTTPRSPPSRPRPRAGTTCARNWPTPRRSIRRSTAPPR